MKCAQTISWLEPGECNMRIYKRVRAIPCITNSHSSWKDRQKGFFLIVKRSKLPFWNTLGPQSSDSCWDGHCQCTLGFQAHRFSGAALSHSGKNSQTQTHSKYFVSGGAACHFWRRAILTHVGPTSSFLCLRSASGCFQCPMEKGGWLLKELFNLRAASNIGWSKAPRDTLRWTSQFVKHFVAIPIFTSLLLFCLF